MKRETEDKLRLAGFPMSQRVERDEAVPSLEELLVACGPHFVGLKFMELKTFSIHSRESLGSEMGWVAFGHRRPDNRVNIGSGDSPSEAVANLWMMINGE